MFKKDKRLVKGFEIQGVLRRGGRIESPLFSLRFGKSKKPNSRLSFIASKKIGHAVSRHRTLRLLRQALASKLFLLQNAYDLVIIAKLDLSPKRLEEIEKEAEKVISRLPQTHV